MSKTIQLGKQTSKIKWPWRFRAIEIFDTIEAWLSKFRIAK